MAVARCGARVHGGFPRKCRNHILRRSPCQYPTFKPPFQVVAGSIGSHLKLSIEFVSVVVGPFMLSFSSADHPAVVGL